MKNIFLKHSFFILLLLLLVASCAKKQKAKQHFTLNIAALQTGLPISGGTYVRAISSSSDSIVKLDENDSGVFEFGNWDFQVVSFEGPAAFYGKRYCGKIASFNLDSSQTNAELTLNQTNCLDEPFVSLITEINSKFANNSFLTVTSITPKDSPFFGGTNVTIKGTAFTPGTVVDIGGATCSSPVVINPTTIACSSSANSAGIYNVIVTNADSQSATLANAFIYRNPPTVSSVSLNAGPLGGLANVTITGTGFYSGSAVTFGGVPCTLPVVLNSTTITCTTPAHSAATVDVVVTNADSQSGTLVSGYTYQPAPVVSNVALNSGALAGGTAITITGNYFLSGALVSLGGSSCSSVNVASSTSITCTTTAHVAGTVNVTVVNPDTQVGIGFNIYTYRAAPSVSNVILNGGSLSGGTTVTVIGAGFYSPSVTFDGVAATGVSINSPTSLTCITPAHSAGVVNVTVMNSDNQFGTGAGVYTYRAAPTVSNVTPNTGDMVGGTPVTITGTGFFTGAIVNLGGSNCSSPNVLSATSITCTTTSHSNGSVSAIVTNPDTQIGSLASAFLYKDITAPTVSGLAFNDGVSEWSNSTSPTFTWNAAIDGQSGVSYYEIALGTTSGGTDVQNWTNIGNVTSYQFTGLNLTRGQAYYASIRATDGAGNTSSVVLGDGWFVRNEMWATNARVYTTAQVGNKLYLGGDFTQIGEWTGGGVPLDLSTGILNWQNPLSKARVSGTVYTTLPDGSGGFYIGGNFKAVSGVIRNNLAHILADGSLDSWNPNVNDTVSSMVINGASIYIGGRFITVNGSTTRNHLAEINLTTGTATSWNPNVNNAVLSMAINGANLYIGGSFTYVNGSTYRSHLAAVALSSGTATSWNPYPDDDVNVLLIDGSTMYIGGNFRYVNIGTTRNYIAALDLSTGTATNWDPNLNYFVSTLAIYGGSVYVGGNFTTVNGGTTRKYLAAFDSTTGIVTSWNPSPSSAVYVLIINGSTLYIGGSFNYVDGFTAPRDCLASYDLTTGLVTNWNPKANANVKSLAISGSTLYAGGTFTSANNYVSRYNLAAIDLVSGAVTSWNPNLNSTVYSILINGSTIYAAGSFYQINGTIRYHLAAFDQVTGALTSWNPNIDSDLNAHVNTMIVNGTNLYVGGKFATVNGGTTRINLAALDIATGTATSWNPNPDGIVTSLLINGSNLYAGGDFLYINGSIPRSRLASFVLSTGAVTSWSPNPTGKVSSMLVSGTNLYIGGDFTSVNNGAAVRNRIASFNLTTGAVTSWNPNVNGSVNALAISGSNIYAGGVFTTVNGSTNRYNLAAFDLTTGTATGWNPSFGNDYTPEVDGLSISGSTLYVGGWSNSLGRGPANFAPLDLTTGLWLPGY